MAINNANNSYFEVKSLLPAATIAVGNSRVLLAASMFDDFVED